jgi:hypothetical protein
MILIPTKYLEFIKSNTMKRAGRMSLMMGEWEGTYRILVGKPAGKRPLGRRNRVQEDNIKMDLKEMRWDGVDWIDLTSDRDL